MTPLALHAWGPENAPRVVFLHGVTGRGRQIRALAEGRLAASHHVVAPDLLGHGGSPPEPPWSLEAHVSAVLETVGPEPATWIGHSFGGRLAFEIAAAHPGLVERLVLLDPAIHLPPPVALFAAENARPERAYASFEEGVGLRYEESQLHGAPRKLVEAELGEALTRSSDGLWRYGYCQASVVAAYGEMARTPPPFESVTIPTLLVLGAHSHLTYDHLLESHQAALGDRLTVTIVDGGHSVLLDALDETADAIAAFVS